MGYTDSSGAIPRAKQPVVESMRTKVFITIDTEFSIGGAFNDPVHNKPIGPQAVLCEIDGKSHGLGFLLSTFAKYGINATFFIEAFNSYYFGDQPMRDLALRIKASGHDIQLHLHPCWTYFRNPDWIKCLKVDPPTDHMTGRSVAQLKQWISDGISIFERWGVGRPLALRTGSLMVDPAVYQAMQSCGLRFASNVGLAVYKPEDPDLHFFSGIHKVGEVTEVCILTYTDRSIGNMAHDRTLTITGASWHETKALLQRAHAANVESVVILTHAFEYVKCRQTDFSGLRRNRINQDRLDRLCEFLRDNPDRYRAMTMSELASEPRDVTYSANTILKAPLIPVAARMLQNLLNDRIPSL